MASLGSGQHSAQVLSTRAGMVTLSARLNGELVGCPATIPVEAAELSALKLCSSGPLAITAGQHSSSNKLVSHSRTGSYFLLAGFCM